MPVVRITEEPLSAPFATLYEAVDEAGVCVPGPRLAVLGAIHGNETVGLDTLRRMGEEVSRHLKAGSLLAIHGNPAATALNERHTPEGQDINRLFDFDTQQFLRRASVEELDPEQRRAREIGPLLDSADAILDLHTTSRPTEPFLLFRDDQQHQRLVQVLGVPHVVTGMHEAAMVDGGLASNAGLRAGERTSRIGFTFEAGMHGAEGNEARAWDVFVRLAWELGLWSDAPGPTTVVPQVYEIMERMAQASTDVEAWRFVGHEGGEPGSARSGPPRQLRSFEGIEAGEVVLRRGEQVIRATSPYTMLMPAPTAGPGADLFFTMQPRHGGLMGVRSERSDVEAQWEAHAVERMLELLDADAYEQGATRMNFDPVVVLGTCAEEIQRIQRLPAGHPHRRVAIVGRGDWSQEDSARKVGQQYRRAMRRAIASGVGIDRYQLLRGASLGWLDALTGAGMAGLIRERHREEGVSDIRMYISDRQPHTVSLLVLGDVELALRTGEFRNVRVVMVVEAATAEPGVDGVRVRVVRAGLVSARREVLVATYRFLSVLRQQHRAWISRPEMATLHLEQSEVFASDGAILPKDGALDALRSAFRRVQVRRWCEVLEPALVPGQSLGTPEQRGRWLAGLMASTGVRDVAALRTLLWGEGEECRVDGAALSRWVADPDSVAPSGAIGPAGPLQPLAARDVDADNLERWIGWKRFLRSGQLIPGLRGRDVSLAFTTEAIHRRIIRLYALARQSAAEHPSAVRIVVCGDGAVPGRERLDTGAGLLLAHRAALRDANLGYMRVQHAAGTNLAWLKDLLEQLAERPRGSAPVGIQWEPDHGASVNVVLMATWEGEGTPTADFSLEGWRVAACAVVLQAFAEQERDYELGLFTGLSGESNDELLEFARAHAEGLMVQGGGRLHAPLGRLEDPSIRDFVAGQLRRWTLQLRHLCSEPDWPDGDVMALARRAIAHFGLQDNDLGMVLAESVLNAPSSEDYAELAWSRVVPWPGMYWKQVETSDTKTADDPLEQGARRKA